MTGAELDAIAAAAAEQHLLFILLDSNLPTGGFIASSGLESYAKHGFLKAPIAPQLVDFARAEVSSYARASLDFVRLGWNAVHDGGMLARVKEADELQEAMMLNHVARRSSKAQGVAMLTLFAKGFSQPAYMADGVRDKTQAEVLMDDYKKAIRRGEAQGHLNVCWGVITAALGVSLKRALHLHLFLHARSLLSSAVRLNLVGPYLSSQLLLHPMRDIIEAELDLSTTLLPTETPDVQDPWDWTLAASSGPATTWPLGELLTGRHDLQHTRIFNS